MCSKEQIAEIAHKLFEDYDVNSDHALSRAEVKIKKTEKYDQARINKLFTIADLNSDQKLTYKEFKKIVEDFLATNVETGNK